MLTLEVVDQARRRRTEPAHPLELFGSCARAGEQPARELLEGSSIVALGDREMPHQHAANAVCALGVFVFPGQRIARARRQHVDVVALADLLGEQPARMFGAR